MICMGGVLLFKASFLVYLAYLQKVGQPPSKTRARKLMNAHLSVSSITNCLAQSHPYGKENHGDRFPAGISVHFIAELTKLNR